jgi:hypothetical protein
MHEFEELIIWLDEKTEEGAFSKRVSSLKSSKSIRLLN